MKKRTIFSFLLAMALFVSVFSVCAFAESATQEPVQPRYVMQHMIKPGCTNVRLRESKGLSGNTYGLVQGGDWYDPIYDQAGGNYISDYIDGHRWCHVHMLTGEWLGQSGYVAYEFTSLEKLDITD